MSTVFLDSFSGAAAALPKGRRQVADILTALRHNPRVSCFDMLETQWLRDRIGRAVKDGLLERINDDYPWVNYVVTKAGERLLAEAARGNSMTTELRAASRRALRAASRRVLESLRGYRRELGSSRPCDAERGLEAALSHPEPRNQCGETCERARLCAACAQAIESPTQTPCSIAEDGVCEVLDCCVKPPQRAPAQKEPAAWTLTETLDRRETTTAAHMWFSDPQNSAWTPLYTHPPRREMEREPGGVCGQCGGWVCDPVVRPGHITAGMPPCEVARSEPRRLTDDEVGRIWFQANIPGLTETNARLLIRAAERFVRGEQGVADHITTR